MQQKTLDGFLLLYSCRVKLPHEAVRSKLASMNIVDVTEEDLEFFKNLTYLDLSDNRVNLQQLAPLAAIQELDLQYNQLDQLTIPEGAFQDLYTLHISYNKVPPGHLIEFAKLPSLTASGPSNQPTNQQPRRHQTKKPTKKSNHQQMNRPTSLSEVMKH